MTKKSTKPTSQSFKRLLKAREAQEIVEAVIACCWEADGNEGKPPRLPFVDLQTFTDEALSAEYVDSRASVEEKGDWVDVTLKSDIERIFDMNYDDWVKSEMKMMMQAYNALDNIAEEQGITIEQLIDKNEARMELEREQREQRVPTAENLASAEDFIRAHKERLATTIYNSEQFHAVGLSFAPSQKAPTKVPFEWLQQVWVRSLELSPTIPHFLVPLAKAWLIEQTAKHVTAEYDRKHPVAVLKHPMGSIRETTFVDADTATLRDFATPSRCKQAEAPQLRFDFAQEAQSILPDIMPLEIAPPMGLQPTTKKGSVSHVVRVFFEALMALEPRQRQADLMFTLDDLINYLYPDGKFNRTLQLPYIINALDILHFYATVPFKEDDKGNIGYWRPVVVRTRLAPDDRNDKKIFLDVKLPPDATQGMIVEKSIMRMLGKQSAPKFNAYLTACWLWDRYGTVKGKLIDPTRPVENRNEQGQLVDPTGKVIVTPRGTPITNLYHPRSISQLERERNPAADHYPVLSEEDLILACNLNGYKRNSRRMVLQRAKGYWTALEKEGIISIHKVREGWRIMPSKNHLQTHRAVREASKKSV